VFEHSPWIAHGAHEAGLTTAQDTAEGLHAAMVQVLSGATRERKLALIRAHPDLAGRLKLRDLTADSQSEQASAGLDSLTPAQRDRFLALNDAYRSRFGFPFIMAVKGRSTGEILQAFEERLEHDAEQEFDTAMAEIERIAILRLKERLPSSADAFSTIG
jgi:OHCU decarboxylase